MVGESLGCHLRPRGRARRGPARARLRRDGWQRRPRVFPRCRALPRPVPRPRMRARRRASSDCIRSTAQNASSASSSRPCARRRRSRAWCTINSVPGLAVGLQHALRSFETSLDGVESPEPPAQERPSPQTPPPARVRRSPTARTAAHRARPAPRRPMQPDRPIPRPQPTSAPAPTSRFRQERRPGRPHPLSPPTTARAGQDAAPPPALPPHPQTPPRLTETARTRLANPIPEGGSHVAGGDLTTPFLPIRRILD